MDFIYCGLFLERNHLNKQGTTVYSNHTAVNLISAQNQVRSLFIRKGDADVAGCVSHWLSLTAWKNTSSDQFSYRYVVRATLIHSHPEHL